MTDRGVSVTVNYAMTLTVAALLLSGLLFASGEVIEDHRDAAVRSELRVAGQRLAAALMAADRLAGTGAERVRVEVSLPDQVAGTGYDVNVNATTADPRLDLESEDSRVSVTVEFANATRVVDTRFDGGDARVVLDGDALDVEEVRE